MELGGYFAALRRWVLTILLATALAGVTGYLAASLTEPTYESSARLLVGPVSSTDLEALRVAGQQTRTYAELVAGDALLETAIRDIPLEMELRDLRSAVSARGDTETRLLTISVQLGDPELAAATADYLAAALQAATAAAPGTAGAVQVIDPAQVPTQSIAPQTTLMGALAAVAGFVTTAVLALFVDYRRNVIARREDLDGLTDVPLLGTLPVGRRKGAELVTYVSEAAEKDPSSPYRRLASALVAAQEGSEPSLLVVGSSESDRSAEVAFNIAVAAASNGHATTLLDADELSHAITKIIAPDLDGLTPTADPRPRPIPLLHGRLDIIPYRPVSLAYQPHAEVQRVLATVFADDRFLVVHAGALSSSPTPTLWARHCKSSVLVALRESTRRHALADTVSHLRALGIPVDGIVLAERTRG